jgi:hypothetical protein
MENVFVLEENTLMLIFNVLLVSIIVPFVQLKPTVLFVIQDISYKTLNVLLDATLDIIFQVLYVKNAKMVALIVKELELVLFVKQEDILIMDYVM